MCNFLSRGYVNTGFDIREQIFFGEIGEQYILGNNIRVSFFREHGN